MEYRLEIILDEEAQIPRILIHTAAVDGDIQELVDRIKGEGRQTQQLGERRLLGFREDETVLLDFDGVYRFFTQGQTVQAQTRQGDIRVKQRLYELEELLKNTGFIRVSHSEIVNFAKVRSFELSISGTINLKLDNGTYAYVSRRNVRAIKEYLGA
jgi:DNA-binding LytR/AlgR family response regulator